MTVESFFAVLRALPGEVEDPSLKEKLPPNLRLHLTVRPATRSPQPAGEAPSRYVVTAVCERYFSAPYQRSKYSTMRHTNDPIIDAQHRGNFR